MIWPTDLVFDPTWPIFELDRYIVKMIILSKFDDWLDQNCGLYSVHNVFPWFELLTLFLTRHSPYLNLTEILSRWSSWANFWWLNQNCGLYSAHNVFLLFYLLTLFFDPTSPIFEHNWDIVTTIILSTFYDDWTKTVTPRVFRRFFLDLTYLPSFWPNIAHIQTWLRCCHDDHSE